MTVSTEVNHNEYTGNGVTTTFPYAFRIFQASDLLVTTSDTNGTLRTLTLNTDYTVSGVGSYSGGTVILPAPLSNGWSISIERDLPVVQETDLRNQGRFFAETHEGAFDYLTMLIQQCFGWLRLTLLKPNLLARYYDAKQNRISNLADPASAMDAVNLNTLSKMIGHHSDGYIDAILNSDQYIFAKGTELTQINYGEVKFFYGPGSATYGGVNFLTLTPGVDPLRASFFMNPEDAIYGAGLGFPTYGTGNFNAVMSIGAHPEIATAFNRTTAFGTNNFTKPIQIDRCEAFGNSALMFMRYGERNSMFGTIAGQWLGTNDPEGDGHELWSNAGGYKPGQPGWDYGGFETANPGIGAKIAASTAYATQSSECARNVGVGRNAFNGSVKLMNCTAIGYRALASAYFANNSSALGTDAFRSGLFLNNSVAVGFAAGTNWQEGERNTVLGVQAGVNTVKGDGNTLLGAFAGSDTRQMNDCLFLGLGAGNDIIAFNPTPSNLLAIGNDVAGVGSPLICGDMASPKVGINTIPSKISGTFHIRSSDAAPTVISPSGAGDDFIIENGGNTGMTIRSAPTSLGTINFSSPTIASAGGIIYNHSNAEMTLRSANADRWKINAAALNPSADNSSSLGTAALRASVIYAASGSINTSDGRLKDDVVEISAAEKRVAVNLKSLIRRFRYSESIAEKGTGARQHFGVIAQDVKAAFEAEGLVAEDYGLLCHDEWDDVFEPVISTRKVTKTVKGSRRDYDTGEMLPEEEIQIETEEEYDTGEKRLVLAAGERYGIRYDELLCFIIAAM